MAQQNHQQLCPPGFQPVDDHGYTVVVPVLAEDQAGWTVQAALDLARPRHGRVILVGLVLVPAGQSLSTGADRARAIRARLECLRSCFGSAPLEVKPRIRVVYSLRQTLAKVVAAERANLVILPWSSDQRRAFLLALEQLSQSLGCHIIFASRSGPPRAGRILVPLRGSPEALFTLEIALCLAKAADGALTLLYATGAEQPPGRPPLHQKLARVTQANPWIKQELRAQQGLIPAIQDLSGQHDLIVMEAAETAPTDGLPPEGHIAPYLHRQGVGPIMVVKTYQVTASQHRTDWHRTDPLPATPISVRVDKWFAENTFNSEEFEAFERLVELKQVQGLTISLGLPSLNEEATIGTIIQTIRSNLMDAAPLLDEIVLIDSNSTDHTANIARDLGIPVYQHPDILPQYGVFRGKGEALWKSLYVLKGDLIVWVDTDIVNIHPRFVYGLLGPLLYRPTVQYVKGFYHRPLTIGDTLQATGGGRVTELVARPIFNLFYPELSGIMQPLAGEYAGRRTALEQLPFYAGYGVETGLLLALLEQYGLDSIAQVDLRRRIHHNQPLEALSRMAFAIIQVFIDHLERRQQVELLNELNRTMKIIRAAGNSYMLEERLIHDQLRPPIGTLPEYQARFGTAAYAPLRRPYPLVNTL